MAGQNKRSRALQRAAILHDDWAPYLKDVREQGKQYARMGMSNRAWLEVVSPFR